MNLSELGHGSGQNLGLDPDRGSADYEDYCYYVKNTLMAYFNVFGDGVHDFSSLSEQKKKKSWLFFIFESNIFKVVYQ